MLNHSTKSNAMLLETAPEKVRSNKGTSLTITKGGHNNN